MAELARGNVTDRPWGRTLGALGARGLTGQLTVTTEGKPYRIAFSEGAIAGATSPLANDAAVRIAMTGGLISSTQVADIMRRLGAAANRDEVDVIAESTKLAADQVQRLRRRLVAQRAARTFSLDQGAFVIDDEVTVPIVAGAEVDVRAVVYLGARNNLSEERLGREIDQLGGWFMIKPDSIADLGQYGFSETEKPLLKELLGGNNLEELERAFVELGPRGVRAIVYSLASCGACEMSPSRPIPGRSTRESVAATSAPSHVVDRGSARVPTPAIPTPIVKQDSTRTATPDGMNLRTTPRAPTANEPVISRTQSWNTPTTVPRTSTPTEAPHTQTPPAQTSPRSRPTSIPPPGTEDVVRMRSPSGASPISTAPPTPLRSSAPAAPTRARRNTAATVETESLIRDRATLVDRDTDHVALLGISRDASPEAIRGAYFALARKLHPDRLASLGIVDGAREAQRLFAQINLAFSVLNDPVRRADYVSILSRGGESAVRAEDARADEIAMRVMDAEEAFRRGEMALRRDLIDQALVEFTTAIELQPNEPEYQALFVWAKFAAAPDKQAVAALTRQQLSRAAAESTKSPTARFYLGRVERILGREREALAHFQEVLQIKPNHTEASSEVRVLESRLKGKK